MKRLLAVLLVVVLCISGFFVRAEAAFGNRGESRVRNGFITGNAEEDDDDEDETDPDDVDETETDMDPDDEKDLDDENQNNMDNEGEPDEGDPEDLDDEDDDLEPCVTPYQAAQDFSNVTNAEQIWLNDEMKAYLAENGFVVNGGSSYPEFYEVYQDNSYEYIPSFVTVDSLMHTFHLYFSYLLKTTEKYYLADRLDELCDCMLDVSLQQVEMTEDTDWEDAALRNVAFFNVAYMLISEDGYIEDMVADEAEAELELIQDASSMTESPIFGKLEDYSQYKPRGYYEGDDMMERYFRTMMWLGRMNFAADDEEMTKSAILITHALKELYADIWETIYGITSYFAGTSDDPGYLEYNEVLKEICGEDYQEDDFMNEDALAEVMEALAELDPPQVASGYSEEEGISHNICFRFMGQRFTLDAAIMQKLVSPEVSGRGLPDVLDFLAALDSDEAKDLLKAQGTLKKYPGYADKLEEAEEYVDALPEDFWDSSLYSGWLYTLAPVLEDKEEGWPSFMQSEDWARKDLETYASSYAELKHDTILYSKQTMAEGDGMPEVKDDRGYVEPEYKVYKRLKELADSMLEDLDASELIDDEGIEHLTILRDLSEQLEEISRKELLEEELSDEDYELIRHYGETLREFWKDIAAELYIDDLHISPNDFPAAVIADIATDMETGMVLEVGIGNPNVIYVVVPVDGTLRVARGAVFSYYQFPWEASDRLTDSAWRQMQGYQRGEDGMFSRDNAVARPNWTRSYRLEALDEDAFPGLDDMDGEDPDVPEGDDQTDPDENEGNDQTEPENDGGDDEAEPDDDGGEEEPKPSGNLVPEGPYDFQALEYAGSYSGGEGYEIRFSAYTYVDVNEPNVKIGNAEIIYDGKSDFALVKVYYYDPEVWDYDAVYAVEHNGAEEYFGFYEMDGQIMMDYFSEDEDFDVLVMTSHYES